jgi:hypothetical protein
VYIAEVDVFALLLVLILGPAAISSRGPHFAFFVPGAIFLLLLSLILLEQGQNIKILLIKENLLLGEALLHDFGLLPYRLWSSIDLLQHHLHERWLELRKHLHLGNSFLLLQYRSFWPAPGASPQLALELVLGPFDANHYPLWVLVFLFLDVSLNLLGIKALEAVGLYLEAVIEVSQIVDVVMDSLRSLLLFRQRHLQNVTNHSIHLLGWMVGVTHLLLDDQGNRFEGAVKWDVYGVLHGLEVRVQGAILLFELAQNIRRVWRTFDLATIFCTLFIGI